MFQDGFIAYTVYLKFYATMVLETRLTNHYNR